MTDVEILTCRVSCLDVEDDDVTLQLQPHLSRLRGGGGRGRGEGGGELSS